MGNVKDFLFRKLCEEYLENFISNSKTKVTKKELIIAFLNTILGSELCITDTYDEEYFEEIFNYYIKNSNLSEEEEEYFRFIMREAPKSYLIRLKEDEKLLERELGQVLLVLIEWMDKNIEIKE
jgi:hypothetical protein